MRALFFGLIIFICVIFITVNISSAVFTNNSDSNNNSFATAAEFSNKTPTQGEENPEPPATGSSTLVINEVSMLGPASNEWVEIFNKSSNPINLNGWFVEDSSASDSLPNVTIPAGGYGVIIGLTSTVNATASGAIEIRLSNATIGGQLNDTVGDEVEIKNGITSIDGVNYGSSTAFFIPGVGIPLVSNTISRISNGVDSDSNSDWQTNTSSTIGASN